MGSLPGFDADTVLEQFPDPIIRYETADAEPIIRWANERANRLFGATVCDSPSIADVLVEFDIRANGEPLAEFDGRKATLEDDGTHRSFRLRQVVTATENSPRAGYLIFTEISDPVETNTDTKTHLDPPAVDRLVSVLSHDLRNPLEVAQIRLAAARETGEDIHFEKIERALDRIEELVHDVRSIPQEDDIVSTIAPVRLDVLASDAWSTVQTTPATLEIDGTPTIEADERRLRQVLENAFRNSVTHADSAVTVRIGLLNETPGFYIADDGPGIPVEDQDAVFTPGASSRPSGTGLGLTIIDRIATAHGWDVRLGSEATGGTRLEFSGVSIVD